jgi:uncharacterized coiled-coil protein SlyX
MMTDDDREAREQRRLLAEVRATLDQLNGEVAALWKMMAQTQKQIGQIHENRIRDLLSSETATDAKAKMN